MSYLKIYEEKTVQGKMSFFISNNELPEGVVTAEVGSIYIYTASYVRIYYKAIGSGNSGWRLMNQRFGNTASRPSLTNVDVGTLYYDTTIDRPLWYTVNGWIDPLAPSEINKQGTVKQSIAVANVTESTASDVNTLKTDLNRAIQALNAKLNADRASGQQAIQ